MTGRGSVSGTQPDSPVGQHRNGCDGCEHPENAYPPCWTDEQATADQEHMRRLILGSPVGGNGVETGAGSAAPGLTGSLPGASDSESGNDGSGELGADTFAVHVRAAVNAWRLQNDPADPHGEAMDTFVADALASYGYVRAVDDAETVDRVAAAIWHSDVLRFADLPPIDWRHVKGQERKDYLRSAGAAVQALRDGGTA